MVLGFPLVMMLIGSYEVVLRNVFNSPTRWAWAINGQLLCVYIGIAGAYVLLVDQHIRMDFFYDKYSPRRKAILNSVLFVIFFLYVGGMVYHLSDIGLASVAMREVDRSTTLNPPLYPLRMFIALSAVLTLLAGIANFTRNIKTAIKGQEGTL